MEIAGFMLILFGGFVLMLAFAKYSGKGNMSKRKYKLSDEQFDEQVNQALAMVERGRRNYNETQ